MDEDDVARVLAYILLGYGVLAISFYEILALLATVKLDFQMAVAAFLVISALLIVGYALSLLAVSFAVIPLIIIIWKKPERKITN